MKRYLIPLLIFVVLLVFLVIGLQLKPREVPSPFIGKPAPSFTLPILGKEQNAFSPDQMQGKVWILNIWASWCVACREEHPLLVDFMGNQMALVNVWASWCVACREEHPLLVDFVKSQSTPLIGLDYKDKPEAAKAWLKQYGDPYQLSISDLTGQVGIDYGVYGVPETFVIDRSGIIRYKHIGPLTKEAMSQKIIPLITKLEQ